MLNQYSKFFIFLLSLILILNLSGCAQEAFENASNDPSQDPYEHYNRNAYRLNDKIDKNVIKPVAIKYVEYVPKPVRESIGNFFSNLYQVQNITSDILQGNFYWTMNDTWSFIINSTVGIAGLFNPASHIGLKSHTNTFGLTFDTWGAKPAPYFVLPVLGPSTMGDVDALPANFYVSPWYFYDLPPGVTAGMYVVNGINLRANYLQQENMIMQMAIDPYALMRTLYLQYRTSLLYKNANPPLLESKYYIPIAHYYTRD